MKNTPPSAKTEKDLEHLREMIWFGMTGLSMIQIKQEHIKAIMSVISHLIDKAVASERTRLLSVESMKMEEIICGEDMMDSVYHRLKGRNELRQSILSEMEKGK